VVSGNEDRFHSRGNCIHLIAETASCVGEIVGGIARYSVWINVVAEEHDHVAFRPYRCLAFERIEYERWLAWILFACIADKKQSRLDFIWLQVSYVNAAGACSS
jgi:hypothetical protein